ncbi:unnamed protein product [Polarella glacialis]|uniref:Uncharacterized protein n=1 Tax=Polarella glacialis TaxID=89957 RepID=A0A813GAY5_POLGL|nr:unnamed protein product [Polarella glacialis]
MAMSVCHALCLALHIARLPLVIAYLPPTSPPWQPTYDLANSTISMQCNSSGWSSPERGAEFGIISYDWSNSKVQWAASKPMDCEERLAKQAEMTGQQGTGSHVFVYRNLVKALPWFTTVREKLNDPAYSGWFLRFKPSAAPYHVPACAAENQSKCSTFYHDQEQTPAVPTAAQPHPDGSCTDGVCDCGTQPCGEYLFDHRNGSMLRDWLIKEHIGGPAGLRNPSVHGFFMDDYWCSNLICAQDPSVAGCPCRDPVQGPTEVDKNNQADMGLSDEDVRDIALGWNETMAAVEKSILGAGAYTWWLMDGQTNANAGPTLLKRDTCASQLRGACTESSHWQRSPQLFGLTINSSAVAPAQLEQDVAFFQLARGDYAWLGWGVWGMTWPFNAEPAHGELPPLPYGVPRPALLSKDFGKPSGLCKETRSGVFERGYTKAHISLDCNTFTASLESHPILASRKGLIV